MTFADALRDATLTVRLWQSQPRSKRDRVRRHVACALKCYPAWSTIRMAIANRLLAHDAEPMRRAA